VVLRTDVFHEADGHDGVVAAGGFAVVGQANFDGQGTVALLRNSPKAARAANADVELSDGKPSG
jgi:hypothetical protein